MFGESIGQPWLTTQKSVLYLVSDFVRWENWFMERKLSVQMRKVCLFKTVLYMHYKYFKLLVKSMIPYKLFSDILYSSIFLIHLSPFPSLITAPFFLSCSSINHLNLAIFLSISPPASPGPWNNLLLLFQFLHLFQAIYSQLKI